MRTAIALLLLAGCSTEPTWADQVVPDAAEQRTVDGQTVWVDDAERVLYSESCEFAERLSSEGEPFGPRRNPDGSAVNGYATICP